MEKSTTSNAAWLDAAVNALGVELLGAATVDIQHLEAWCEEPDVIERNIGKFATPFGCYADSVEESGEFVAKVFPEVEAGVGEFPDTVDTVCTLRFGKHIFKCALKIGKK